MVADKSLKISEEVKKLLDAEKLYDRETYDDIIKRLMTYSQHPKGWGI